MNIIYICAIISILLLLTFTVLSFIKSDNYKIQLAYVIVASFNIGVISSIILINYDNRSAIIWPGLFLVHVISKALGLAKALDRL